MLTVVMIILGLRWIVLLWLCHRQAQDAHANRALQQSLAPVLLPLCFACLLDIVAKLAVEVIDFFFQTKTTETFGTLDAQIHLLLDKLSATSTSVVHVWRSKLSKSEHVLIEINCKNLFLYLDLMIIDLIKIKF